MKIYLLVILAICLFAVYEVQADCRGKCTSTTSINNINNIDSLLDSVQIDEFQDSLAAGFMAVSQIDFSSSTKAWQVGVGVGHYESENAVAVGVGKLLPDYDVLIRGTLTNINSDTAYGAGIMWKIQ
jgi:autotransporter adhesin